MILPYKSGLCSVISKYGSRTDPITGESGVFHFGIDFIGKRSIRSNAMEIISVNDGIVTASKIIKTNSNPDWVMGNFVVVEGDDGVTVKYAHLYSASVKAGDRVSVGDTIGYQGESGRCNRSHLHLECSRGNYYINPAEYLGIPNKLGCISDLTTIEKADMWQEKNSFRRGSCVVTKLGAKLASGKLVPFDYYTCPHKVLLIKNRMVLLDGLDDLVSILDIMRVNGAKR